MKTVILDCSGVSLKGGYTRAQVEVLTNTIPGTFRVMPYEALIPQTEALILSADRLIVVAPVYWGRLPGKAESILDGLLLPGIAYKFKDIPLLTKWFGFKRSEGLTKIKEIYWVLNYGAPRLAMFGVPFFRLGFMISKLILRIPKVRHIPTYLSETSSKNRDKTLHRLVRLFK